MKNGIAITLFLCIGLVLNSLGQFNPQTASLTKRYFPDPELNISTPAFQKKKGFTNYVEMMVWLEKTMAKKPDWIQLSYIGESQKGKKIPMLIITQPNKKVKTRVWMQGGLHGDEPAGTETMLYLIDQLLSDPALAYLLEDISLAIVPMANIDGYEKQERYSANGIDLNRDQTQLRAPETVALKKAFNAFNPAVALDFHEYRPFRKDYMRLGKAGITSLYDAMFLYSGNLNVPPALRKLTDTVFVENARKSLAKNQLRHQDYFTPRKNGGRVEFNRGSIHSRSSATSFALANSVSTLFEIRGVGIGRTSFKRRIKTSYLIALSYLETTYQQQAGLRMVLENPASQAKVFPLMVALQEHDTLQAIDLANEEIIRFPAYVHNALKTMAMLERKRPEAYLLLASEKEVVRKLRQLGIEVDSLLQTKKVPVEVYTLGTREADEVADDGDNDDELSGESRPCKIRTEVFDLPAGTYIVYMNQQRSNLAAEVLEPESPNGFLSNQIMKVTPGNDLPLYRCFYLKLLKP